MKMTTLLLPQEKWRWRKILEKSFLLLICMVVFNGLNAQCDFPTATERQNEIVDAPVNCGETTSGKIQSGHIWEYNLISGRTYTFQVCYDQDDESQYPQIELWGDLNDVNSFINSSSGTATVCAELEYAACTDNQVYLQAFSHSCLPDWDDWDITINSTCCTITCPSNQHVTANGTSASGLECIASDIEIPAPTISEECMSSMVSYQITGPAPSTAIISNTVTANSIGTVFRGSGTLTFPATGITINGDLMPGVYTTTWSVEDCGGVTTNCSHQLIVEPVMACNNNVNVTLPSSCWLEITPDMILEGQCAPDSEYLLSAEVAPGAAGNVMTGSGAFLMSAGIYNITATYNPTVDNPFSGTYCWGTVTVEDKIAPSCNIENDSIYFNITCMEDNPEEDTAPFTDCSGLDESSIHSTIQTYGNCGDMTLMGGGATDGDHNLVNDFVNGVLTTNDGTLISIPSATINPTAYANFIAYRDAVTPAPCSQPAFLLDAITVRTYTASDIYGNLNNGNICKQYIFNWRPSPNAIYAPSTPVEIECGSSTDVADLQAMNSTYVPYYIGINGDTISLDTNHGCGYTVTSNDQLDVDLCGDTKREIRKWTVLDCCTLLPVDLIQLDAAGNCSITSENPFCQVITTVDREAPIITCPAATDTGGSFTNPIDLGTLGSGGTTCMFNGTIDFPAVMDNCSNTMLTIVGTIYNSAANGSQGAFEADLPDATTTIQLDAGAYQINFVATDDCGNSSDCRIFYEIVDDEGPIISGVGAGDTFECDAVPAFSSPTADDVCSSVANLTFVDNVTDTNCAGDVITRTWTATDASGNTSTASQVMTPVDNTDPVITDPPADATYNCEDVAIFPTLTATDNCGNTVDITTNDVTVPSDLGNIITRTWTATDACGNSSTASQTLTPEDTDDPVAMCLGSTTPIDISLEDMTNGVTEICADDLDDSSTDNCGIASILIRRTLVGGAYAECLDISCDDLGTTISIDVQVTDFANNTATCVSMINIVDNDGVCSCTNNLPVGVTINQSTFELGTDGRLTVNAQGTMNNDLINVGTSGYSIEIGLDLSSLANDLAFDCDDKSLDGLTNLQNISVRYFNGTDEGFCSVDVAIIDDRRPQFTCPDLDVTISTTVFPFTVDENNLVDLATDFDNCGADNLDYTFSFTGSNIPTGATANVNIDTYNFSAGDGVGSYDVLVTATDESDNSQLCISNINFVNSFIINGQLRNEEGASIEDVEIALDGTEDQMMMTLDNGTFEFEATSNESYLVAPQKDTDPLNGVTTFDIVLITKHILGKEALATPYKLIAADVNNDGKITTADAVELRRLILYLVTDFPTNTSWRFVDANYKFPNIYNPWVGTFPELYNIGNLEDDMEIDFIGIKVGDVNCSAVTNNFDNSEERNKETVNCLSVEEQTLQAGETYVIDVKASQLSEMEGMQFTLDLNKELVNFESFDFENTVLNNFNIGSSFKDEGLFTVSWVKPSESNIQDEAVLFKVKVQVIEDTKASEVINISSRYTKPEAYLDGNTVEPVLEFVEPVSSAYYNTSFDLYQNQPNPFSNTTNIGFYLPVAQKAMITVFDISGKIILEVDDTYPKGYNEVVLDAAKLNTSGVLYYQLNTEGFSATRKMIVIE